VNSFSHEKNRFAEVSKNLTIDTELIINLLNYQNNYVEHSNNCIELSK